MKLSSDNLEYMMTEFLHHHHFTSVGEVFVDAHKQHEQVSLACSNVLFHHPRLYPESWLVIIQFSRGAHTKVNFVVLFAILLLCLHSHHFTIKIFAFFYSRSHSRGINNEFLSLLRLWRIQLVDDDIQHIKSSHFRLRMAIFIQKLSLESFIIIIITRRRVGAVKRAIKKWKASQSSHHSLRGNNGARVHPLEQIVCKKLSSLVNIPT